MNMEWSELYEKYSFVIWLGMAIGSYWLFVKHWHLFPDQNVNMYTQFLFIMGGVWLGNNLFNIEKMKIENTDWIKTENSHETVTKVEPLGMWTVLYVGGWNSLDGVMPSSHGDKIYVVPTNCFLKKGVVFDIRSIAHFCPNGMYDLPPDVFKFCLDRNLVNKKFYFGNRPDGHFFYQAEYVTTSYVQSLHNNVNRLQQEIDKRLSNYESYTKGYTDLRENLDPTKEKGLLSGLFQPKPQEVKP